MTDSNTLRNRITRAKRKLTTLRKRNQENTGEFEYWLNNLTEARQALYDVELAKIAAQNGPVTIGKMIAADGGIHVRVSTATGRYIQNIDKSIVPELVLEEMQVVADYTEYSHECAVRGCDRRDTQYHHFAPRHLFDDADNWPCAYLCKYHHDLWHNRITGHWQGGSNGR